MRITDVWTCTGTSAVFIYLGEEKEVGEWRVVGVCAGLIIICGISGVETEPWRVNDFKLFLISELEVMLYSPVTFWEVTVTNFPFPI